MVEMYAIAASKTGAVAVVNTIKADEPVPELKGKTTTIKVVAIRVVLRWNCAKVIANIDDLAITIWVLKVIDELSQIDNI